METLILASAVSSMLSGLPGTAHRLQDRQPLRPARQAGGPRRQTSAAALQTLDGLRSSGP